jgi:hypothetical protein
MTRLLLAEPLKRASFARTSLVLEYTNISEIFVLIMPDLNQGFRYPHYGVQLTGMGTYSFLGICVLIRGY